jgi:hypothetical protein
MPDHSDKEKSYELSQAEVESSPSRRSSTREDDGDVTPHEVEEKSAKVDPGLPPPIHEETASDVDEDVEHQRAQSRASSTRSRPLSIVPRAKRRGLFAQLAFLPEVDRPYDYSNRAKWTITTFVAIAAAAAPMGSAIFYREPISDPFVLNCYS